MTDYYTQASVKVPMSLEDAEEYVRLHEEICEGEYENNFLAEIFDKLNLESMAGSMDLEAGHDGLWIHSPAKAFENEYAAAIVSHYLQAQGSSEIFTWEYALSASRPVADGFGGGFVVVSAHEWSIHDASNLVEKAKADARREVEAGVKAHEILTRAAQALDETDEDDIREELELDDLVHKAFSAQASDLNNLPIEKTLQGLVKMGFTEKDILGNLA